MRNCRLVMGCVLGVVVVVMTVGICWDASGAVEESDVITSIQEQIISFRKEFKLRMERAEEDRQAVYGNIQEKFKKLQDSQSSFIELQPEILRQLAEVQPLLEQYGKQIDVLEQVMETMEQTLYQNLDNLEAQLEAEKTGATVSPRVVPERLSSLPPAEETVSEEVEEEEEGSSLNLSEGQLFRLAYRYFMEGEYEIAIGGFQKYLADYPEGQLAGPAQYWIAEAFVKLEEYEIALQEYNRLINEFPRDNKVSDAHYGIGVALLKLDKTAEAQAKFQYVADRFGGTIAAQRAQNRLEEF